jgi:hypothetical protein
VRNRLVLSKLDVALWASNRLGPTEYWYRNVAVRSYSEMSGTSAPAGVLPATGVVPAAVPAAAVVSTGVVPAPDGAVVPPSAVVDDESSSSPPHAVTTTPAASARAERLLNRYIFPFPPVDRWWLPVWLTADPTGGTSTRPAMEQRRPPGHRVRWSGCITIGRARRVPFETARL